MICSLFARPLRIGAVALALSACAGYSPMALPPGTPAAEVRSQMGEPTASRADDRGGHRLEYAKGPFGKHTFMVDLDTNDRLVRVQQVLTRQNFDTLSAGMPRDEVLYRIGQPSETRVLPRRERELWAYRFESAPFCEWFLLTLDSGGQVVDTGYGPDPLCTPRD